MILTRALTILGEMVYTIRVAHHDLALTNLGDQLRCPIYNDETSDVTAGQMRICTYDNRHIHVDSS